VNSGGAACQVYIIPEEFDGSEAAKDSIGIPSFQIVVDLNACRPSAAAYTVITPLEAAL
jgi:hypothetical protein